MAPRSRTPRQRWSETFKKRVATEACEPGMTVAQIARRYDLDARRVSNWMKKFGSTSALIPIEVTSDGNGLPVPPSIEIDLPCGTRLRCASEADIDLVTGIITALRLKR